VPEFTFKPSHERGIGVPAARLGNIILRMIESPHVPMSPIEIMRLGRYETFKTAEFNFPPPKFEI
jgi:hypothetical protein